LGRTSFGCTPWSYTCSFLAWVHKSPHRWHKSKLVDQWWFGLVCCLWWSRSYLWYPTRSTWSISILVHCSPTFELSYRIEPCWKILQQGLCHKQSTFAQSLLSLSAVAQILKGLFPWKWMFNLVYRTDGCSH
jgi:hypothetical protein